MKDECFLIAEIGQTHEGSVGLAESLCYAVSKAGFDAVKFQMHLANEESTLDEQFRTPFSFVDKTRFDYWERTSFSISEWKYIVSLAKKLNLKVGISPFSKKAVDICRELNIDFIKLGSGEVFNQDLINYLNENDNVIMSSGMSTINETVEISEYLLDRVKSLSLTHCHSAYPCEIKDLNLSAIEHLKNLTGIPVGYSDHSGNSHVGMAAIANKAQLLEVHCVFSRDMFGPDSKSSLIFKELEEIKKFRDVFYASIGNIKNIEERENSNYIKKMKQIFGRSISLKRNLPKGYIIKQKDIIMKKPYGGISFKDRGKVINAELSKDYDSNYLLREEDLKND